MAISTPTSANVKAALGAAVDEWSLLIKHASINKWSRKKPVRGEYPQGEYSYYGFNLAGSNPNKFNYLQPRGGASNDEPLRAGDFRGYEHDKSLTDPPVYADSTPVSGDIQPTTKDENVKPWQGTFRFGKNTVHNDIRILPSDIGVGSYYWGVALTSPSPTNTYYKTLGNLDDNAVFVFDTKFTDPGSISFANFPPNYTPGEWRWQLFISYAQASSWTTSAPTGVIFLPTDADITRLISSGTFNMLTYIVFGQGDPYVAYVALPDNASNFPDDATTKLSGYGWAIVNTNSEDPYSISRSDTWFHFAVYNSSGTQVGTNDDETDVTYLDTTRIRVWCDQNTGAYRSGTLTLTNAEGGSYEIAVNQDGAPATLGISSSSGWGVTLNGYVFGASDVWVQFTVTGMPTSPQTVTWGITRDGVSRGSGTISVVANGVMRTVTLNLNENVVAGASYGLDINDGS